MRTHDSHISTYGCSNFLRASLASSCSSCPKDAEQQTSQWQEISNDFICGTSRCEILERSRSFGEKPKQRCNLTPAGSAQARIALSGPLHAQQRGGCGSREDWPQSLVRCGVLVGNNELCHRASCQPSRFTAVEQWTSGSMSLTSL